jgi:hypothetical protein
MSHVHRLEKESVVVQSYSVGHMTEKSWVQFPAKLPLSFYWSIHASAL